MTLEDNIIALARTTLIEKKLYKFRSFSDDTQKNRTKDILLNHRIRFSRPSELNDPIEGKPIFCLGDWESSSYRKQFEEWVWFTQQHIGNRISKNDYMAFFRTLSKKTHEDFIRQITEDNQAGIEKKWKILSLSANSTNDLLWSHYADSHRGLAIVFDASADEFGIALKVSYLQERIPQEITTQDEKLTLQASILTKRLSWSYEEEYRCIAGEPQESHLKLKDQFLYFDPSRLVGVIFGSCMATKDKKTLVNWSNERDIPLIFWEAKISESGNVEVMKYDP